MGTNMYPSSALLGAHKDKSIAALPVNDLIEKADGFAGVFLEHKYEFVKCLQARKHICGMTGDGVNDAPALEKADIGIAVADATDVVRSTSDIVLTEPGLSIVISAVLTSVISQRMKNYTLGDPSRRYHSGTRAALVNTIPKVGKLKTGFFHGQYYTKRSFHGKLKTGFFDGQYCTKRWDRCLCMGW